MKLREGRGDEESVLYSRRRQMAGLSPKLTSLLYNGYSAAPDPEEIYHEVIQIKLACCSPRSEGDV